MAGLIEDYALIGDCETAALVGRDGSIDWLCWPRFDSDACFAALLGAPEQGRWRIGPAEPDVQTTRRYLPETLVLETLVKAKTGVARVLDFMPLRGRASDLVRLVEGLEGQVAFDMELRLRFGYGATVPWVVRHEDGALEAIAGPDRVILRSDVEIHGRDLTTVARFEVAAGETRHFVLSYSPSIDAPPPPIRPREALEATLAYWAGWSAGSDVQGGYAPVMRRSLITLKALTHAPSGGIVAAPTTSLPEQFGGTRNWDYRYCWIRDATLTLLALMNAGHYDEARAWTEWLHRSVAGRPQDLQIMYGLGGERRLMEWTADWLPGYGGARPVRIGNAAHQQLQLDVYGELMDAFHQARLGGLAGVDIWAVQQEIMKHLAAVWREPDEGIWESRGGRRQFTFSKVMAWVAADRAVKGVELFDLPGPVESWRALRQAVAEEVSVQGFNPQTGGFQRAYDDPTADASLLLLADLGFLEPDDPRFAATVAVVERDLMTDAGLVLRYDTRRTDDGLPPGEGAFLPCSFWLANAYVTLGRRAEAEALFQRLLGYSNDLGLLAEEYDPVQDRLAGNFPQAFSHVALLSTALNLSHRLKPSAQRPGRRTPQSLGPPGSAAHPGRSAE